MHLEHLTVADFRNYEAAELAPPSEGVTLFQGDNGAGKTNLLEAVGYLATLRSFRGAPTPALVRNGAHQAVLRGEAQREGRRALVEVELSLTGKDKARLNRQVVRRSEDLLGAVLVTVFSPGDIEIVKGGPEGRRAFLDGLAVALQPRHSAACSELERVLKQRNALLKSANGSLRASMVGTLEVWDAKLASVGEAVAEARESVVLALQPEVVSAYGRLTGLVLTGPGGWRGVIGLHYERSWSGTLLAALTESRAEELRRGVTVVGPQRDELRLTLDGLAARSQASQGEQRSLALALRLGGHCLVSARRGTSPVLLLDDIFSELDPGRCAALAACLPQGQSLVTAAGAIPPDLAVADHVRVSRGALYHAGAPQA
ncbi:MAG: DNA replication/repair protein RecF [Acidimicrobiales bacterium]